MESHSDNDQQPSHLINQLQVKSSSEAERIHHQHREVLDELEKINLKAIQESEKNILFTKPKKETSLNPQIEAIVTDLSENEKETLYKNIENIEKTKSGFNSLEQQIIDRSKVLIGLIDIQEDQHFILNGTTLSLRSHQREHPVLDRHFRGLDRGIEEYFKELYDMSKEAKKIVASLKHKSS